MKRALLTLSIVVATSGCAARTTPPPVDPYVQHTISRQGETLGAIASWYTGSSSNWREIEAASPGIKANRLRIGQVVNIPRAIVTRQDPMPERLLVQNTPKDSFAMSGEETLEVLPVAAGKAAAAEDRTRASEQTSEQPRDDLSASVPSGDGFSQAAAGEPSLDTQLYHSVMFGDPVEVKRLIEKGANVNYLEKKRPLLGWAAQLENVEVVKTLIQAGADLNSVDGIGQTPLMRAADMGQVAVAKVLLEAKADSSIATPSGETAVSLAVKNTNKELIDALLQGGANPNIPDKEGVTPLLSALQWESVDVARALLAGKADPNKASELFSPLSFAINQGNPELVQALLDAGANPNTPSPSGQLPLILALDKPGIFKALLQAKADPNTKDQYDAPLLFVAIRNGNSETVVALIEAGADISQKDYAGNSPLELARRQDLAEVVALLEKRS